MNILTNHPLATHPIDSRLLANCSSKLGIKTYTTIQHAAIPEILADHDCLVKAQTGSGKTLAYLLPVLTRILEAHPTIKRTDGLFCLILTPTRELTQQVYDVLLILTTSIVGLVPSLVVGGDSRKKEKARIRKGVNVLVGTPGRLLDHVKSTSNLNLSTVEFLVIDEADRVLDAGFEQNVLEIVQHVNTSRCSVLVSATLTDNVRRIADVALQTAVFVDGDQQKKPGDQKKQGAPGVSRPQDSTRVVLPASLTNYVALVPEKYRLASLIGALRSIFLPGEPTKAIVFFSCIASVDYHYALFSALRFLDTTPLLPKTSLFKLHGDLPTVDRHDGLAKFQKASRAVLLTTDVAARGIDLKAITWIVQYDPPGEASEYIHRVGRTARIGNAGNALLMLLEPERDYLKLLHDAGVDPATFPQDNISRGLETEEQRPLVSRLKTMQTSVEELLQETPTLAELARKSFTAHVRSYTTHRAELRAVFSLKRLHLGHICKSFGLRDAPTAIRSETVQHKAIAFKRAPPPRKARTRPLSEFDSGLAPRTRRSKKPNL